MIEEILLFSFFFCGPILDFYIKLCYIYHNCRQMSNNPLVIRFVFDFFSEKKKVFFPLCRRLLTFILLSGEAAKKNAASRMPASLVKYAAKYLTFSLICGIYIIFFEKSPDSRWPAAPIEINEES